MQPAAPNALFHPMRVMMELSIPQYTDFILISFRTTKITCYWVKYTVGAPYVMRGRLLKHFRYTICCRYFKHIYYCIPLIACRYIPFVIFLKANIFLVYLAVFIWLLFLSVLQNLLLDFLLCWSFLCAMLYWALLTAGGHAFRQSLCLF